MKIARQFIPLAVIAVLVVARPSLAAPVESVESARSSAAFQKVDAFLSEKLVADRLAALGVSREQVSARLAMLNDTQLEQLAAQVDLIQAGGTIQGGEINPVGPFGCVFKQLGVLLYNIYQLVFCWGPLK